jgi:hypothetical protein
MSNPVADQLNALLSTVDPHGTTGRRLLDNSSRLCSLTHHLLSLNLIPPPTDTAAIDLACSALQLTLRHPQPQRSPMTLRDRAESAVELLISSVQSGEDGPLLDRACQLLQQIPQRAPATPEARLLADAVNLEDFGLTGMLSLMVSLAVAGDGITQLAEACSTREQYGYWDARLARFHFPAVRELATRRLASARQFCAMLDAELPGAARKSS